MSKPSFRKKKTDENKSCNTNLFSSEKYSVGSVRKTQLITTFGVGAMVDFKDDTVMIAGIDSWDRVKNDPEEIDNRKIYNENLSVITGAEYFLQPKTTNSISSFSKTKDIQAYLFPEKMHCSVCGNIYDIHSLDIQKRHKCPRCGNRMTASRFVVLCPRGHIDDFPYSWWVHQGKECPKKEQKEPRIRMYNINNRSDISSLRLECTECGAIRNMATIFSDGAFSEYKCTCKYPHFIDPYARAEFGCDMKVTAMPRSKSGVYFPITRSALLIPPWSRNLVNYIQRNHDLLRDIPEERLADAIRRRLNDPSLIAEDIMRAWKAVNHSVGSRKQRTEDNVMRDEYDVLSGTQSVSDERFSSYRAEVPNEYSDLIDIVSVIDRLTVTQALTGFSRKLRNENFKAPLSQYVKNWLPAVELTGEGIFIRLNQQKVYEWAGRNSKRYDRMKKRMTYNGLSFERFSPVYVLLHTFAHLFIREISNYCGYSAASIREKIYSGVKEEKHYTDMCGILVYVSSADSDSSLGGLISIADDSHRLGAILTNMLERAEWCSGDPLCITSMQQGYQNLNYASCYDCTLLPETSCERFNIFLDSAAVIGVPDNKTIGYFTS